MYSSEQNNADVQFNADDSYGDEKGFVEDIKNRKSQLLQQTAMTASLPVAGVCYQVESYT